MVLQSLRNPKVLDALKDPRVLDALKDPRVLETLKVANEAVRTETLKVAEEERKEKLAQALITTVVEGLRSPWIILSMMQSTIGWRMVRKKIRIRTN